MSKKLDNLVFYVTYFSVCSWLFANQNGYSVTLLWDIPVSNGGSNILYYNVYRSDVSGSNYQLIGNTTSTSFVDNSVVAGKTYYYVLTAVNIVGESVNSIEVQITIEQSQSSTTITTSTTISTSTSMTSNTRSTTFSSSTTSSTSENSQTSTSTSDFYTFAIIPACLFLAIMKRRKTR